MNPDDSLRCRRAVMRLTEKANGEAVLITCHADSRQQISAEVLKFTEARRLRVAVAEDPAGVKVTRDDTAPMFSRGKKYQQLDVLKIGESYCFDLKLYDSLKVRQAASARAQRLTAAKFTCERIPGFLKVTRVPADTVLINGRRRRQPTVSLAALHVHAAVAFDGDSALHARVRHAAFLYARRHDWVLYTRADVNKITVYRLDNVVAFDGQSELAEFAGNAMLKQVLAATP